MQLQNKINKEVFQEDILTWYDNNKRVLPWRNNKDPYYIWVSEIMLQQTRVQTVIPYFERFLTTLPTIEDLAICDEDRLLKLWEGLGYYNRVRNMQKAAKLIMEQFNGEFPSNQTDLELLPGIGSYTSGAILSIAFNQPFTAVDGNVLRVFARLLEIKKNIKDKDVKKLIKGQVEHIIPENRIDDFNQSLMEIGAIICIPNGVPKCEVCPLKIHCQSFQNKTMNDIPLKQKKVKTKVEKRTVFLLQYDDKYAVRKRSNNGLLAGMYEFLNETKHLKVEEASKLFPRSDITILPKSTHQFSHLKWDMIAYRIKVKSMDEKYLWRTKKQLDEQYSIPTAFKKYKNLL
jgi:A/G-specific adenine glycosylase